MYSKEEKKAIVIAFWTQFKAYSNKKKLKAGKPGKWMLEHTGIKQLRFKFHFDTEMAWAGLEIDTRNLDKRIDLFDKLEKLKSILTGAVQYKLIWELEEKITAKKSVSRVYSVLHGVNILDQSCWMKVNEFMYNVMGPIEDVYKEYYDFLKY